MMLFPKKCRDRLADALGVPRGGSWLSLVAAARTVRMQLEFERDMRRKAAARVREYGMPPKLREPACVGNAYFYPAVSARLVVQAAQRLFRHKYGDDYAGMREAAEEGAARLQGLRHLAGRPRAPHSHRLPEVLAVLRAERNKADCNDPVSGIIRDRELVALLDWAAETLQREA